LRIPAAAMPFLRRETAFISGDFAMSRRAFTLIELLIVVAIIAVLAAIAVPNLLEAQTRAKVARVKADMRSFATGMEAYVTDNNKYPIPSDSNGAYIPDPQSATLVSPFETRMPLLLTTPISYISSRIGDPFAVTRHGESQLYHCVTYDYVRIRQDNAPVTNWLVVWRNYYRDLTSRNPPDSLAYFFVSFGPDQDHDADLPHVTVPSGPHVHGDGAIYNPTNGTISSGDVFYFGPGVGFLN
jgi:prepilin-type N-terminal cleavage/methylation domain-containing protein